MVEFYKSFESLIEGKNSLWKSSGLKVSLYSQVLQEQSFEDIITTDIAWAGGAVIFAFIWILVHTSSFIYGLVSVSILFLTFPAAAVICEGVF